jgi:hypothetical protein
VLSAQHSAELCLDLHSTPCWGLSRLFCHLNSSLHVSARPTGTQSGWGGDSADTGMSADDMAHEWGEQEAAIQTSIIDPAGQAPKALAAVPPAEQAGGALAAAAAGAGGWQQLSAAADGEGRGPQEPNPAFVCPLQMRLAQPRDCC